MANNRKLGPVGLDAKLDKAQKTVYDKLIGTVTPLRQGIWNGATLNGYPRCEPLQKKGSGTATRKTIEYFNPATQDYEELVYAEANKFFFVLEKAQQADGKDFTHWTANVDLYFMVNSKKLKTAIQHNPDAEIIADVVNIVNNIPDFKVKSIDTKFDEVFRGYDYEMTDTMRPYTYFKLSLVIYPYRIDETNCQ